MLGNRRTSALETTRLSSASEGAELEQMGCVKTTSQGKEMVADRMQQLRLVARLPRERPEELLAKLLTKLRENEVELRIRSD